MANWEKEKPYVYKVNTDLSVRLLKGLLEREFDVPFTADGTMDGEEVLTTNFLNPKADKKVMLLFTNGYVPPLPWPKRCYKLGQAIREILDEVDDRVLVLATAACRTIRGRRFTATSTRSSTRRCWRSWRAAAAASLRNSRPTT